MNWVDDNPCEGCGSQEHLLQDCLVFHERVQEYKERQGYLIGRQGYMREDHKDFEDTSSYYPRFEPPPPSNYQYYYSSEEDWEYNNCEPDMPYFANFHEEYDD